MEVRAAVVMVEVRGGEEEEEWWRWWLGEDAGDAAQAALKEMLAAGSAEAMAAGSAEAMAEAATTVAVKMRARWRW